MKTNEANDSIVKTQNWVKNVVVNLGFCPFAFDVVNNDLVRYLSTDFEDIIPLVNLFNEEADLLIDPHFTVSTTLIIIENGLEDFHYFLNIIEACEESLTQTGKVEHIQLAHFHPEYLFEGVKYDDITNCTNRAPYPTIQLLKVEEMATAIKKYGDAEKIPVRNQEKLKSLGIAELDKILRNL